VIDNGTTDPTYVPFAEDSDPDSSASGKVFNFTASSFRFDVTPALAINPDDKVTFRITNTADIPHGFTVVGPDNQTVIGPLDVQPGQTVEKSFTATEGLYTFGCSHVTCGVGHSTMTGSFQVGKDQKDPPPGY
jgi:heme/copper-type cytochrome/quinol oxidase subunit 2